MSSQAQTGTKSLAITLLAFASVYLVWGSTYLVIRIGVREMSPAALLGLRFLIAGLINAVLWAVYQRNLRPTLAEARTALVAGVIMLVGGTGIVGYAERTVNSSTAALCVAISPLWFAVGDFVLNRKPLRPRQIAGIAIGLSGVWFLVWPAFRAGSTSDPVWTSALFVATIAWVSAGLYSRHRPMPKSIFLAAGIEMIGAGLVLMVMSRVLGEFTLASFDSLSRAAWGSVIYLAIFGSCVAFTAYAWLLKHQPTHRVASYAYVNPAVAVLLGVLFDGDPITVSIVIALALVTLGVTLTMARE